MTSGIEIILEFQNIICRNAASAEVYALKFELKNDCRPHIVFCACNI